MATGVVHHRCFPLSSRLHYYNHILRTSRSPCPAPLFSTSTSYSQDFHLSSSAGSNGGGGGGWIGHPKSSSTSWVRPIMALTNGWRSRVSADPQFPYKVLMEQLVGVTTSVFGDMLSRPNFGLDELDFIFSTITVASILVYLLSPRHPPPIPRPNLINSPGFSPIAPQATCSNPDPTLSPTDSELSTTRELCSPLSDSPPDWSERRYQTG